MTKPNLRLAVSMTEIDNSLLIKLRSTMELKNQKRLSLADVVREALRCLAEREEVND